MNRLLVDSSFLYALYNPQERYHQAAFGFLKSNQELYVLPDVVLTEVAFLLKRFGGEPAVMNFLEGLAAFQPPLEAVTHLDLTRAREIMGIHLASKLDFVDCCIMALSERLDIKQVCTFDRRDFSIFRPKHCVFLELLP